MFNDCDLGNLKKITGLNTSKCSNFDYMFYYANLTNLEQLTLDTQSGTGFRGMFQYTVFSANRDTINLADLNTSNVTTFNQMFNNSDYIPTKDFSK